MPTYEQNKAFIKQYMSMQDEIRVRMPKETGLKEAVQNHAKQTGESVNKFVVRAIMETMQRDLKPSHNMDDGVPPAIQAYFDEVEQYKQEVFEKRKAIIDATSYVGNNCDKDNPVWKDRTKSKKAGE